MSGLRWTEEQYKAHAGKSAPAPEKPPKPPGPQYRSQLEADYAVVLDLRKRAGEIEDWEYEGVKLVLKGRLTYTPDFVVFELDRTISLHETKGYQRDSSRDRMRVAVEQYPGFRWFVVNSSLTPVQMRTPDDVPSARKVVK